MKQKITAPLQYPVMNCFELDLKDRVGELRLNEASMAYKLPTHGYPATIAPTLENVVYSEDGKTIIGADLVAINIVPSTWQKETS